MQLKDEDTGLSYKLGSAATASAAVATANDTVTFTGHGYSVTGDKFTATTNAAFGTAGT